MLVTTGHSSVNESPGKLLRWQAKNHTRCQLTEPVNGGAILGPSLCSPSFSSPSSRRPIQSLGSLWAQRWAHSHRALDQGWLHGECRQTEGRSCLFTLQGLEHTHTPWRPQCQVLLCMHTAWSFTPQDAHNLTQPFIKSLLVGLTTSIRPSSHNMDAGSIPGAGNTKGQWRPIPALGTRAGDRGDSQGQQLEPH